MKKLLCVLLITLMILTVFSGCAEKGADEQLIYPIDEEPRYLDPQIAVGVSSNNIIANCFEGLVSFDSESNIVPAAAESYVISSDSMTYTFRLRQNMKWKLTSAAKSLFDENESNELAVTADDFIFGLRRAVRAETNSPNAVLLNSIKNASKINRGELDERFLGVSKKDDYTLVIELERPDCDFLYTLTLPLCMPCDEVFFEKTRGRYGLSTGYLIFNGPFYISNWAEGTAISTRRNDLYHSSESVKPYSIYFSINSTQETRGEKVKNGTYQVAPLTETQKTEIERLKDYSVKSFNNSLTALLLNCKDEILKNANIRKAIVSAFDPTVFLENSGREKAAGIIPGGCLANGSSYRERIGSVRFLPFDKAQAKSYYQKGIDTLNLRGVELVILCREEDEFSVRSVMQQWQSALGVSFSIDVEAVDEQTLKNRVRSGNYQLAIADVSFSNSTALSCLMSFCSNSSDNIFGVRSEKFDMLVENVKNTSSTSEYLSAIKKAEYYLIACGVIAPIYERESYSGISKGVDGVTFSPLGEVVYLKEGLKK